MATNPPTNRRRSTPPRQRQPEPTGDLLRLPAVANRLGVHVRTVNRLIAEGRLAVVEISPRRRYVDPSDLEAFLERSTKPATK